jgi:hypothetical protein
VYECISLPIPASVRVRGEECLISRTVATLSEKATAPVCVCVCVCEYVCWCVCVCVYMCMCVWCMVCIGVGSG